MKAVGLGNLEKVRTLLESGAAVNAVDVDGSTPLMIIASWGRIETLQHLQITELLLENGAEVNIADKRGHTPLMAAAQWGRTIRYQAIGQRHLREQTESRRLGSHQTQF